MSLRCKQTFSGKEKCLLGQLLPFGTSCSLFFKSSISMITLTAVRDRGDKVYSVNIDRGRLKGPQQQGD
jgi:hypothetical protein